MKASQEFKLHNVSCMSCVSKIEKTLAQLSLIDNVRVNFAERTLLVLGSVDADEVITALAKIGYQVSSSREEVTADILHKADMTQLLKIIIPTVLGLFIMVYGMSAQAAMITSDAVNLFWLCMTGLTLFILFYAAQHMYYAAYKALLQHHATMDTLISLGTLAAWGYSAMVIFFPYWMPENARHVYLEASLLIIALVNLGAFLEVKARGRTSLAIQHLIGLQPQTAHVVLKDAKVQEVAINYIKPGDLLRVRPGEKIALDGIVVVGKSHVDESMLTGEGIAVSKNIDDEVYAGTINKNGSFTYKVTKATKDTLLAQIVTLVKNAQSTKPSIAKLADVVSSYFVPAVMICAVITALIWFNLGFSAGFAVVTSITVLVIACPCALGLATPISVIVGMGKAAQMGVLIRNGEALQKSSQLNHVVLDKTGTITKGEPEVIAIECVEGVSEDYLLQIMVSIEAHSEHPLAEAIVKKAKDKSLSLLPVSHFYSHTGLGVSAKIEDKNVAIGNVRMMENCQVEVSAFMDTFNQMSQQGQTVMFVALESKLMGIVAVADPINEDALAAIKKLEDLNIKITMVTGDNKRTAWAIASQLGIKNVMAEVMPQDKASYIASLQQQNQRVAMVGDGINDAPALTQADVGFAIGNGTDIALESADITLMRSSLTGVVDAIAVSQATMRNIKQNLWGAFIYNGLGIPIAAGALFPLTGMLLNPIIAGAVMAASSLTVIINANRLRFFGSDHLSAHRHPT